MSKHRKGTRSEEEGSQSAAQTGNNMNLGNLAGIINSIDINSLVEAVNSAGEAIENGEDSGDYSRSGSKEIILALRTLMNADKALLLQTMIQIYALSRSRRK